MNTSCWQNNEKMAFGHKMHSKTAPQTSGRGRYGNKRWVSSSSKRERKKEENRAYARNARGSVSGKRHGSVSGTANEHSTGGTVRGLLGKTNTGGKPRLDTQITEMR